MCKDGSSIQGSAVLTDAALVAFEAPSFTLSAALPASEPASCDQRQNIVSGAILTAYKSHSASFCTHAVACENNVQHIHPNKTAPIKIYLPSL